MGTGGSKRGRSGGSDNADDVVRGLGCADIAQAMEILGGEEVDGAGAAALGNAVDGDFDEALFNQDDFLVGMLVGRVGNLAGTEGRDMALEIFQRNG